MTEPENLILRHLRAMDAKLDRALDQLGALTERMTALEDRFASMERRLGLIEHAS